MESLSSSALVEKETQALLEWVVTITDSDETYFSKAQQLARKLGAHYRPDGLTEIGFWTPELAGEVIQSERMIYLEVFTPIDPIDFRSSAQTLRFRCDRLSLPQQGEYIWGVISGMKAGTRDQAGSFYWLKYLDPQGHLHTIRDVVPYSLPYGVFAPAELYDIDRLQRERSDLDYFRRTGSPSDSDDEIPRRPTPVNLLQIHISTASKPGTLEGLTQLYQDISDKLASGRSLTPAEENYVGYDGIQLLPIEPTIEFRHETDNSEHEFFAIHPLDHSVQAVQASEVSEASEMSNAAAAAASTDLDPHASHMVDITLRKPNTLNWGYDIPILGSSATNPAILGSLRPDELIDFIGVLHNFSQGPIQVIYDLVYGHADNQSEQLLSRQFLKGPNMYGQDLNHQLPAVRANLLEMQRRKLDSGADGIRVDGGQDFRFFNPISGRVEQDDAYLLAMSDVVQEIGGYRRLVFTIFEDGRPWPQEGWEETSTYRDLIELKPDSFQWGPLIFAHNTPALEKFWDQKWRRVSEVMIQGSNWITGCANHDTVRRGNQIDPNGPINWNLGHTHPEVLNNAYDNPAVKLWVYAFSPGLPMDFINALMHAAWGFFRNTDERYGVKVASEEIGFLDWQVEPEFYEKPWAFSRLKALGFSDYDFLRGFAGALRLAMVQTDYDLEAVAVVCQNCLGDNLEYCELPSLMELNHPEKKIPFLNNLDVPSLKKFAMAFMEDMHDLSNVSHYVDQVNSLQTRFSLDLRQFRLNHAWLRENLTGSDRFNRVSTDNHTLFYGLRSQPTHESSQSSEQLAMVTHMGGDPAKVTLADWLQLDVNEWEVAIATPGLDVHDSEFDLRMFELKDSQGLLLMKKQ
ncbi:MAG TPA: glucosylglycerol hydrolase [Elainellaceae cyanobacterium]